MIPPHGQRRRRFACARVYRNASRHTSGHSPRMALGRARRRAALPFPVHRRGPWRSFRSSNVSATIFARLHPKSRPIRRGTCRARETCRVGRGSRRLPTGSGDTGQTHWIRGAHAVTVV